MTGFARILGDQFTRLDRSELALNDPSGPPDTTAPRAMAGSVRSVLLGDALGTSRREMLEGWMAARSTGRDRLRAGLPATWPAGDKTGTGETQTNDLALDPSAGTRAARGGRLLRERRQREGPAQAVLREAVLRGVGELVARWPA